LRSDAFDKIALLQRDLAHHSPFHLATATISNLDNNSATIFDEFSSVHKFSQLYFDSIFCWIKFSISWLEKSIQLYIVLIGFILSRLHQLFK